MHLIWLCAAVVQSPINSCGYIIMLTVTELCLSRDWPNC